jgi:multidrug transporter EmrE-like cation transporter
MTLVVLVSLLAAVCFGVGSALQHDGALRARRRSPLHPGLLAELATRRVWLLGLGAQCTGVALHLVAVNLGPLSLVQPLLTSGLVIALWLQRRAGRPVSPPALLAAGLVVGGLVMFLAAMPEGGAPAVPVDAQRWQPGLVLAGVVLAGTLLTGLAARATVRCVCLGAAAGTLLATSAALGKAWGSVLATGGPVALVSGWQLWAALACGATGTLLSQAAFQSGPLGGSLAAMTAIDPAIGVGLGVVVFAEPFAAEDTWPARCLGLVLTLVGVVLLALAQRADANRPLTRDAALAGIPHS